MNADAFSNCNYIIFLSGNFKRSCDNYSILITLGLPLLILSLKIGILELRTDYFLNTIIYKRSIFFHFIY